MSRPALCFLLLTVTAWGRHCRGAEIDNQGMYTVDALMHVDQSLLVVDHCIYWLESMSTVCVHYYIVASGLQFVQTLREMLSEGCAIMP